MKQKKNRKKNKQRKMLLSILMLLVTASVFTASSVAWFTVNKTVTVDTINVNVATSNGLQISTDAINWKTVITNEDILGAYSTYGASINQLPSGDLEPVSSVGGIDTSTGYMKMFLGQTDSDESGVYTLTATQSIETRTTDSNTGGYYVAFDLFLQSTSAQTLYLKASGSSVTAGDNDSGIQNAARVAFLVEGVADAGDSSSAQALKGATEAIIWEPNYDTHTATGAANSYSLYGVTLTSGSGNAQQTYYGVNQAFSDAIALSSTPTDTNYLETVSPGIATITDYTSDQELIELSAGITKIRVYMWIEGQDVDCEDYASGGSINYNLQFTTEKTA